MTENKHMDRQRSLFNSEEKRTLLFAGMLLSLSIVGGIVPFVLVMKIVRELAAPFPHQPTIIRLIVFITCILLLKTLFYALSHMLSHTTSYNVLASIRLKLVNHLKQMNIGYFNKNKIGDMTKILNFDVEQIELYLAHGLSEIAASSLIILCSTVIVTTIDYRLGLCLIFMVPVVMIFNAVLQKNWADMFTKYFLSLKTMSEKLMEYISTISAIKAFSKNENRTEKVLQTMHEYNSYVKRMSLSMLIPAGFSGIFLEAGVAALAIFGSLLLQNGQITLYELVLAVFLATAFCASLSKLSLSRHFGIVYRNSTRNIHSILSVAPDKRPPTAHAVPGDINFNHVTFSYEDGREVLSDVSLNIPSGSLVALTGVSGAGKSSMAHLIMGFFKADTGSITINGVDINTLSEKQISQMIAIVQQDVFLFNTTIRENIRIGNSNATDLEVVEAARKAQIHNFIQTLPDGYDTLIGEKGSKISGGEKQRISIARALLKNTSIIILDEATSSVDSVNEFLIQQAINELRHGKTVIMITHNLNTIVNADCIFLMDNGKVLAKGSHEKLYRDNEFYQYLWKEKSSASKWTIKEVC